MLPPSPIWNPTPERMADSAMQKFRLACAQITGQKFNSYSDLHAWSISAPEIFWDELQRFVGLTWQQTPNDVYKPAADGSMLGGSWFPEGRLNYAEELLQKLPAGIALTAISEDGSSRSYSAAALRQAVAQCAQAMRSIGIVSGDRVVGSFINAPEAVIAMLATAAIGAIWSSCSPDLGAQAVIDRFAQLAPKLLFATVGYRYNGKTYDCTTTMQQVQEQLPSLCQSVWIPLTGSDSVPEMQTRWTDFLATSMTQGHEPELHFASVAFAHPLVILFSSGTTGKPKCIIHGHGGTLLQHLKELVLHCDVKPGDSLLYYTTCSWMMWNWSLSSLAAGARLVLFDGSLSHPDLSVFWRFAASEKVTHLGLSPKFLGACRQAGITPMPWLKDAPLRTILSTGAPLLPDHCSWVYSAVGTDLHLASISGGTDIISCFMLGNPELPVYSGVIQCLGLGMAVSVWSDCAEPVPVGQKGELVCTKPFVSMPLGFWGDPQQEKFRAAYFQYYPEHEVWRHGDYIAFTEEGGIVVWGRSDATLNPGGVRIGTAELYRVVEAFAEIQDAIAAEVVDQEGDGSIALFVKMHGNLTLSPALEAQIKAALRRELSPRHVPRFLVAVQEIPYTHNGKKVEVAVRAALEDLPVTNMNAIANPDALMAYRQIGRIWRQNS